MPPCQAAFPDARRKSIGRTTWFNRQESVRMVVCYRFGLEPSADFTISWSMACGVIGKVIGKRAPKLALFEEGACSGVELAGQPKEPTKYIGIACSWAATLLGSGLGSAGCTLAPPTGHALGSIFESKHELDVAVDVAQHGRCIKNSPTHFGSSWLAVRCASGDQGFSSLPLASRPGTGGGGSNPGSGGSGGGSGGGGTGQNGPPTKPPEPGMPGAGIWTTSKAELPDDSIDEAVTFPGPSSDCALAACAVFGLYGTGNSLQNMIQTVSPHGAWAHDAAPLPPGAIGVASQYPQIACMEAGTCVLATTYEDAQAGE